MQFYIMIEKGATLWHYLNWSHYKILMPLNDTNKINYYINRCIENSLSIRQLQEIIKNKEYDRLPIETRNKIGINLKMQFKLHF